MAKLKFLAVTAFCLLWYWVCAEPLVETDLGPVRGFYQKTVSGRRISSFIGVPYAKPPVGGLRFEAPVPASPWPGVINASLASSVCLQYDHFLYKTKFAVIGSEDCLYLNVYTPKVSGDFEKDLLDVVVFIHGGAFMFHSANILGPDLLLDRDVVLVTMNYRLGPLGFMSTGDSIVPGNNGLKDQQLAMKWVQNNIKRFGGDPGKVVLAGMSAGAASVHFHMLSPKSKGLFNKAIALSGSALCPWAQAENSKKKAEIIAEKLGCPVASSLEMVECLKNRPANQIVQLSKLFIPWLYSPFSPFGPVVEPKNPTSFIEVLPSDIIKNKSAADIPFLLSFTSAEGLYPGAEILGNKAVANELSDKWDSLLPHLLDFNFTVDDARKDSVGQKLKTHFVPDEDIFKNKDGFIRMLSERLFTLPVAVTAKLHAKYYSSPVHVYQFSYEGKYRLANIFMAPEIFGGASHGDDLPYIIKMPFAPVENDQISRELSKRMIDLWMDFIHGRLDKWWKTVKEGLPKFSFLNIKNQHPDEDNLVERSDFAGQSFWSSLKFNEDNDLYNIKHDEF
ncbi:venom carboxylesterase-6-like [Cimex lectularius]|uniref:Carboxylic ester hydrolase n=1 Tax=Cimex lectularius TaxID=79782 RepID=A0A8I6RFU3_CIMLE|nr:venom carboxylesterase-6-like [Cimex lectularius]